MIRNGCPDERRRGTDGELTGPGDDPADNIGGEQQHRTKTRRVRQQPAVVGAGERAHDVRHGQPDERDGADRGGHGGGAQQRRAPAAPSRRVRAGAQPEGGRGLVAERQRVQRPGEREREQQRRGR